MQLYEDYLLSIAIPTRNRSGELVECLQNLVSEIEKTIENIEIVVSDNGSNDNTLSVLQEFSSTYDFVRYVRMETNMGFDLNLLNAIENSTGMYIWTFSDDDIIANGSLVAICDIIRKYEPSYIITAYNQFTVIEGKKLITRQDPVIRKNKKNITKEYKDENFITLLMKMMTTMTFLPINIFKSNKINLFQVKNNINKVRSFSHIYMMSQATINGGGYITPLICVSQRTDNSNAKISVFLKSLPETFSFIFDEFNIDSQFRTWFFKRMLKESFSIRSLLYMTVNLKMNGEVCDTENDIDYRINSKAITFYFSFIFPILPRRLLLFGVKIVRWMKGKGFNLENQNREVRFS